MTENNTDWRHKALEARIQKIESTIFGGEGYDGLFTKFTQFVSTWQERERGKAEYDDRQSAKLNVLIAIGSLFAAIALAVITLLMYEHETHHSMMQPQSIIDNAYQVEYTVNQGDLK